MNVTLMEIFYEQDRIKYKFLVLILMYLFSVQSSGYYKCTGGEFKGQEEKCLIIITPVINYVNVVVQLDQTNIMIIENVLLFLVKKQIN